MKLVLADKIEEKLPYVQAQPLVVCEGTFLRDLSDRVDRIFAADAKARRVGGTKATQRAGS